MKSVMKQRLVGTIVIGSLAIIFIPIMLDGEGVYIPALTTNIPEAPPMPVVPEIEPERPQIMADTTSTGTEPNVSKDSADEQGAANAPPPAPERPQLTSAGVPATWVVRLGSFGEAANAEALVGRLQTNGYKGFSRPLRTSRGPLTGVYVGPVLTKTEAESLQQQLTQSFDLEGVVIQFSIDELQ